ncbi:MAG: nucleotidyltransferase domain-containing protein [Treponema sp.]|nr:nucleotidyltransferase domain-containing protein [Treponema sp.]
MFWRFTENEKNYSKRFRAETRRKERARRGKGGHFLGIAFSSESYYIANMDAEIKSELDTLKEIIIRTVPVEQIWLFGSYAYGTPHKDSDLDLYVVLKDDVEMRLIDVAINIRIAIGRKKTMPVDVVTNTLGRYKERSGFPTLERTVANKGIKIYG